MDFEKKNNNAPATPVKQRLYDAIRNLDNFFADFQDKLQRNDSTKEQCDSTYDRKRANAKQTLDNEKNRIGSNLHRARTFIDSEIEREQQQFDITVENIDKDVENYRKEGIGRIDNELKLKCDDINKKIAGTHVNYYNVDIEEWGHHSSRNWCVTCAICGNIRDI